ncbi:S4 domain-containing protein [Rhabdaerophilum sp. SD176]|uniref:RNA-binding S4 domain-containing protein n=1 Tax=Rhabdaerophilum sp. SD176 TaxID=2983548 RepID=UPI0024E0068F|nr:S4 domain-containing protein [Rhabdaerophilum sp. SD176]
MGRGSRSSDAEAAAEADDLRLDRWIWFARFQRSREACADLVRAGRVRLNGRRVQKPGAAVAPGDILTLALPGRTIVIEVLALAGRRGDANDAARLYRPVETP